MIINECVNEINMVFKYKSEIINGILHTSFDFSNPYVTIIVPGIFGDRGDSRAMFTQIARNLGTKGFSVLRFDFLGGGSNLGDYSQNDFASFIAQLDEVTSQLLHAFGFMQKIIYIGFSEGLKFAFHAATKRNDVVAIISCNGLCVEESYLEPINRPKIKNQRMVYDSNYGTWLNWNIAEKYKKYFVDSCDINKKIEFLGVYSTNDIYSENSRLFWKNRNWPLKLIPQADHLFTKSRWVEDLSDIIAEWHCKKIKNLLIDKSEFFLHTGKNRICIKLMENAQSTEYILFLHGLFQNKSGPGFLFTQMGNKFHEQYNVCMFDYPASGDSDGKSQELTFELMEEVMLFIIHYIRKRKANIKIIGISSGCSNYLLFQNQDAFDQAIMLFPERSNIWGRLHKDETIVPFIDTCDIYDKYIWAEKECCILGNVYNRSKGMYISTKLLKRLSEFSIYNILDKYTGYAIVNQEEYCINSNIKYVDDKQGLAMSAEVRDNLILEVNKIIENITSKRGDFGD